MHPRTLDTDTATHALTQTLKLRQTRLDLYFITYEILKSENSARKFHTGFPTGCPHVIFLVNKVTTGGRRSQIDFLLWLIVLCHLFSDIFLAISRIFVAISRIFVAKVVN